MTPLASFQTHGEAVSRDSRGADRALARHLNDQEYLMTPPPAACTTAAAIRTEALAPALDLIAIAQIERHDLAVALYAVKRGEHGAAERALRRIASLFELRDKHARRIAGFVDHAAERLDYAERKGSYDAVVNDVRNGRQIAARLRTAIEALADHDRRGHDTARDELRAVFETFGAEIFESRIACHLGKQRTLAIRGEFDRWQQNTLRANLTAGDRLAEGSRILAARIARRGGGAS